MSTRVLFYERTPDLEGVLMKDSQRLHGLALLDLHLPDRSDNRAA